MSFEISKMDVVMGTSTDDGYFLDLWQRCHFQYAVRNFVHGIIVFIQ